MRVVPRRIRSIAFLTLAVWIVLSPAYVQVFGGRPRAVRAWRMFHDRGVGRCSAVYYDRANRIDRYALFGLERATAPDEFRRIGDVHEARAMAQQICEKLRSAQPEPDVRATFRCGVSDGMETLLDREENLCAG